MPMIGALMGKMLFVLMDVIDIQYMREQADLWCLLMLIISLVAFVTGFCQKFSFGVIGENVTFNVRRRLYRAIIEKHQGWFDNRDHSPGILTTNLSADV